MSSIDKFLGRPSDKRSVLYQMGKVGSTAIQHILSTKGIWVLHIHSLNRDVLLKNKRMWEESGRPIPPNVVHGLELESVLHQIQDHIKVITLVRDPIARDVSVFFQNSFLIRPWEREFKDGDLEGARDAFLQRANSNFTLNWFDAEMKRFLDIDVYASEFNLSSGHHFYESGSVKVLLLKHEAEDATKLDALRQFFGMNFMRIPKANVTAHKDYGDFYQEFLSWVSMPEDYVKNIYQSKFAKHFYSDLELKRLTDRWVG
jgi:hypothetical protein